MEAPQVAPQAPEAQQPAEAPKPKASTQIEALMRAEQKRIKAELQLKSERQKLEEERKSFLAEKAKEDQWRQTWKDNPLKAIQERGLSPEELWLAQQKGQMTPEIQMKLALEKIQALEARLAERDTESQKAQETRAQEEFQQADAEALQLLTDYVDEHKDKYPLTAAKKRADLVHKYCDRYFDKHGQEIPVEKACELIEAQLLKRAKEDADLLSKTVQASEPQPPPTPTRRPYFGEEPSFSEKLQVEKPVKTLAQVQPQSVAPQPPSRYRTEEEREASALALLRAAKQRRGLA